MSRPALEGVTLEAIVNALVGQLGWEELRGRFRALFYPRPSVKSSLILRALGAAGETLYLRRLRASTTGTGAGAPVFAGTSATR
jgi:uncharacterized protein (DUF2132 family)